jgi:hypothetical protein
MNTATTRADDTRRSSRVGTIRRATLAVLALGLGAFVVARATDDSRPLQRDPPAIHIGPLAPVLRGCIVVRGAPRAC